MTYLSAPPLAIAHRGGAGLPVNEGRENTLAAFGAAIELGCEYLETDVHASSDGVPFVFHDGDAERILGVTGALETFSAAKIRSLRTASGEPVPTLAELLDAYPGAKFNIDVKTDPVVAPAVRVIREAGAADRVLLAAFSHRRLRLARELAPEIATSASPLEVARFALGRPPVGGPVALQIPATVKGRRLVTPRLISTAHARGVQVHVWTIDDPAHMRALLDLGVDGIVSDRPDLLLDVLRERGEWPPAS